MNEHCPCIAINHGHKPDECDEPASASGYAVCTTCRYKLSPERKEKPKP